MDIQSLKKYIHENDKIEYVLSSLGCHKIKHNEKRGYYSAAHKDGDNPAGVIIYDNEYLNYISYSRNVTSNDRQDIIDLIQYTNKIDFISALKWLHKVLDIEFTPYIKPKKEDEDKVDILSVFSDILGERYHIVDVADIHEIDEEAIDEYVQMLHINWFREGIMPWTRKKFGLCYSYRHNRMIVPLRYWIDGALLGFNQRTMVENWKELGISKYFITPSYQKGLSLYGLWENKKSIEEAGYCVVVESEKSVLKRDSRNDGTCIALQGKTMSEEQQRIIRSLNISEVIIALDKDVPIDEVRCMCEKFYGFMNVSYIWDKWGLLGDKDSPCDADNKKYGFLFKWRVEYDENEHRKYIESLKI